MPATLLGLWLGARLRPRHDLHQQSADTQSCDVLARHRQAREQPHQDPVEAVFLRRARAARRAEDRLALYVPDQHQVAGIDRHAEMLDLAAHRLDRGRNNIAAVGDGGGAEHHHQLGALLQHFVDGLGHSALLMGHAALGDDDSAGRRQPNLGDAKRLLDHLGGEPRQQGRNDAYFLDLVRRNADERLAGDLERGVERGLPDRERNDLHRRDHLAFDHRLERRQSRESDRLIDPVEVVNGVFVDHQDAGLFSKQVGAAGEGAIDVNALPCHRLGDLGRGTVLGDVARLEPRHHDVLDAGRLQRRNFGGADQGALLQHQRTLTDGVDRGGALGLPRRDRAELHVGSARSACVISPMIATAISAGDTASMSSPIGEWMRPMSLSVKPRSAFSRSTRRAWVFREPSAPM